MTDRTNEQLKAILENAAQGAGVQPADDKGKVGAFYASFMDVAAIEKLTVLRIPDSRITDTGLEKLTELQELKLLDLRRTEVTNAGLSHLKKLPSLSSLYVDLTLNDEGARSLGCRSFSRSC